MTPPRPVPLKAAARPTALFATGLAAMLLSGCLTDSNPAVGTDDAAQDVGQTDGGAGGPDLNPNTADAEFPDPDDGLPRDAALPDPDDGLPRDAGPPADAAPPLDQGPRRSGPGGPCAADADCAAGACIPEAEGFSGGYCAVPDCSNASPCADGTTCVDTAAGALCAVDCGPEACREGYACQAAGGAAVCLPGEGDGARIDGLPCADDAQCGGGACITDWPGGFCTTVGCATRADCARGPGDAVDNRCYVANDPTFCVRICQAASDCRTGYVCQAISQNEGFCAPDPNEPLLDPAVVADSPLGITCQTGGGNWALPYAVAAESTSYMVVPFTIDGASLTPRTIALPDGGSINLRGENAFQSAPAQVFGGHNPTVVPATDAFEAQLQSGDHVYNLTSDTAQMCWYLLEESTPGTTLDLNLYLVDIGLSAATAPNDADFQAMLGQFAAVYGNAGVQLGTVRYFDVTGDDATQFRVIRAEADVGGLLTRTAAPGPTRDDVLSLNVAFVRTFALPGGGGILGISQGLPGPAGLHGTRNSGVVFTAEFLGERFRDNSGQRVDGNLYTGNVMAHEVGHYLGLFHTTEQDVRSTDPLADTPNCRGNNNFPSGCADGDNLMFPFAGADNSLLSDGQINVLRRNPLTKD